ncbi:cytochrome p450 [Trichoderma arundinaceum]|uniref:Cytochrome p450 n=1 Tax=Trichoderma arundinaceum TaxID=490622 RepID=A0A395NKD5_TRIAR|nr:cytochrome p450 [Trichoderma arundinaceum]
MAVLLGRGIIAALNSSWQAAAGVSLAAGVVSHHLVFRPFEIDGYAWHLVFTYFGAAALLIVSHVQLADYQLVSALLRVLLVASAYNVGTVTSILVYRAFFHPLRQYPGPFWARLSRFYALGKLIESRQPYGNIQKLHQQYGDIVRVGPRELSINCPSAIHDLYGTHAKTRRSTWYMQTSKETAKTSLFHTRVPAAHKLRKKAWEMGLGFKGFSQDFEMLKSTNEHPAIQGVHESVAFLCAIGAVPWLLYMIAKIPGLTSYNRFYMWCNQQLRDKRMALTSEKQIFGAHEPRDVMSWLFKAMNEESTRVPLTEAAIQEDARLLILAGSLSLLANNPRIYQRLQAELQKQFPGGITDWTYEKAKTILYVDHVIYETLRLRPSVPAGLSREVPPQGLTIDGEFIPGGTIVAVPTYTIQRDARYWAEPLAFRPERWEGLSTEKSPWLAFARGQYVCPGRHLAMMGLRMVLSRIALQYNIEFPFGRNAESLSAEQARAILTYLCDDSSISTKMRSYAKELKGYTAPKAICVQCDLVFDPKNNIYKDCCYHSGEMEVDDEGDFWADHDEDCHGIIDSEEMRKEFSEGFTWNCCNKNGEEEGCQMGRHQADPAKSKRGMGYESGTDAESEPDEEDEEDEDEDDEDGSEGEQNEPDKKRKRLD